MTRAPLSRSPLGNMTYESTAFSCPVPATQLYRRRSATPPNAINMSDSSQLPSAPPTGTATWSKAAVMPLIGVLWPGIAAKQRSPNCSGVFAVAVVLTTTLVAT